MEEPAVKAASLCAGIGAYARLARRLEEVAA